MLQHRSHVFNIFTESNPSPPPGVSWSLTVVVGVAQGPGFVGVEVGVPPDAGTREVGVGQEPPLPVEGRAVPMETGGKEDHDVGLLDLILDVGVGHLLPRGGREPALHNLLEYSIVL